MPGKAKAVSFSVYWFTAIGKSAAVRSTFSVRLVVPAFKL
jgi:hypothetical protein